MENVVSIFAERLREAMLDAGLSQCALSKALGLPQSTISRYLHGQREISIGNLVNICRHLNVSADYMLGLSEY